MATEQELVKQDRISLDLRIHRRRVQLLRELYEKRAAVLDVLRGRCGRLGHEYNSINSDDGFWPGECIWCGVERASR